MKQNILNIHNNIQIIKGKNLYTKYFHTTEGNYLFYSGIIYFSEYNLLGRAYFPEYKLLRITYFPEYKFLRITNFPEYKLLGRTYFPKFKLLGRTYFPEYKLLGSADLRCPPVFNVCVFFIYVNVT